ncbi:MAG TPA: DNA-directed RNA polymerase subunit B'' [Candidatus Nanoarchaeia archaeon]|nr:DNA-directed RNA polymerase subunit B'' [Candidatus Nanoarchaeia archaeon]
MNKDNKRRLIVSRYLEQHSLVESNIVSFNDFVEHRMQAIVDDISKGLKNDEVEITLGKIRRGKPDIHEADGSTNPVTPTEARLRNLTYSAPIYLEMTLKQGGQTESHEVEIGRIPIMVKSTACNVHGMNKGELEKNFIDPMDPGGYFIVNGNERVMVMIEDLAANQPFIEKSSAGVLMLRLFSKRGAYRIPVSIAESKDGIIEVSFSRFKNIPSVLMLKALGMEREADIAKAIGKETDSTIVNLYEFADVHTAEDSMAKIAEKTSLEGTKKEVLDRVKQRIDAYFMPHIGTEKQDRIEKAVTLCKLIKQLLIAKENPNIRTDKDHYSNKRVRLSGDLMADLFRVNLNILIRDIQYTLQKIARRKKFYSMKTIAKSTLFSHRIESAIATGNWIGEKTGVTQNMDKTNSLAVLSQLQRVASTLTGEQENFAARTLHPTHYGRFCPIETPEGTEIGLRKYLSLLARISTHVPLDEPLFVKGMEKAGLNKESGKTDVFFNGRFIGYVNEATGFIKAIRDKRRKTELPTELSVTYEKHLDMVSISTDPGRVLRPLIIAENGIKRLKDEHIVMLEQGKIDWNGLLKEGVIEYLDAAEEENALIALNDNEITPEHTHLEIDTIDFLGAVTSLVPYGNHDQSSRLNRGSKTQKQALGLYSANFHSRLDTDVSILHYPQKPIVRSFTYDKINIYPAGQNVVVAVMTYEGYNMEDAVILNKGSVERGVGRSTYFKPYTSTELHYAGGLSDEICIPSKDTGGYRTEAAYRFLEDDGIAYPESVMQESEVVIGKVSPPKFLSEAREITIKTKKESSSTIKQEEKGVVDGVFITIDREGNKVVHVRTRDLRIPELGDKFSTAHGQKGVVGAIVPEMDIPFTARGVRPDLIFNPHSIPGRMTVGYLLELISGKVGCVSGKIVDGTSFSGMTSDELEKTLQEHGFRYDGKETMYDGVTGKQLKAKIFIGDMYYLRLKYMVANKMHVRASGKVALLTRQPVEGRSRGGALRLGEMEQQALAAHGASLLLKERYDSDKVVVHICSKCGAMGIKDNIRNRFICPLCNSNEVEPIEISYAFKLLLEELMSLHILAHFDLKNKYE